MILEEVTRKFYILNTTSTAKMGIYRFHQNFPAKFHLSETI